MSSSTTQSPAETSPQAEAAEASGGAMTPITNSPKRAMTRSYRKEKNLESPNLSLSMWVSYEIINFEENTSIKKFISDDKKLL